MRDSLNARLLVLLGLLLLLGAAYPLNAAGVAVTNVEVSESGEDYVVAADIDFQLSKRAIEALNNGVALFWRYRFKVTQQRNFVWDKKVLEKNFMYRIQYHALLKMYRVTNEHNGKVENFSTLPAALDLLSTLRDYRLIEKSKLLGSERYQVGIKVGFEQDSLPLPLRPVAYLNPDWYLSSAWTLWPLEK